MRLRNNPKAKDYLFELDFVLNDYPIKLDENTILEVGMGKGEMLSQIALNNPDLICIGIEKSPTVAFQAAKKAQELNLKNFFIVCNDIEKLLDKFEGKLKNIWLTFSDPWPKKRHYKRRLTYRKYLDIYKNLLSNDGILKIKTDNDLFFDWSKEEILDYGAQIIYQTNDLHNSSKNDENIKTGYEIKWSSKGKNINYMEIKF